MKGNRLFVMFCLSFCLAMNLRCGGISRDRQRFSLGLAGLALSKPNWLSLNRLGVFKPEPKRSLNRFRLNRIMNRLGKRLVNRFVNFITLIYNLSLNFITHFHYNLSLNNSPPIRSKCRMVTRLREKQQENIK